MLRQPKTSTPHATRVRHSASRQRRDRRRNRDCSTARMRAGRCRCRSHQTQWPRWLGLRLSASSARCWFVVSRISASCISHKLSIITASVAAYPRPFVPDTVTYLRPRPSQCHADGQHRIAAVKDERVPTLRARSHIAVSGRSRRLHEQWSDRGRAEVRSQVHRVNMVSRRNRHNPHARRVLATTVQHGRSVARPEFLAFVARASDPESVAIRHRHAA